MTETVNVEEGEMSKKKKFCSEGGWSYIDRPLVHVFHTLVVDQQALVSCGCTKLVSLQFGSHLDNDIKWVIKVLANDEQGYGEFANVDDGLLGVIPRMPTAISVAVMYYNLMEDQPEDDEQDLQLYYYATVHAQEGTVDIDEAAIKSLLEDKCRATTAGSKMGVLPPEELKVIDDIIIVETEPTITLRVDIAYVKNFAKARPCPVSLSQCLVPCSLAKDMEKLLGDEASADAVLVDANGNNWKVHKAILSARSPVFAAMFQHDMEEKKSGQVTIEGVSGDVLQRALRYIYTGLVDSNTINTDLLCFADRYHILRLKKLCEKQLASSVQADNALDMLLMADSYNAKELGNEALQCVSSNIRQSMGSPGWKEIVARPQLLSQVLARCVNYEASG